MTGGLATIAKKKTLKVVTVERVVNEVAIPAAKTARSVKEKTFRPGLPGTTRAIFAPDDDDKGTIGVSSTARSNSS